MYSLKCQKLETCLALNEKATEAEVCIQRIHKLFLDFVIILRLIQVI